MLSSLPLPFIAITLLLCSKGLQFYGELTELATKLRASVRSFVTERTTEREALVAKLETEKKLSASITSPPRLAAQPPSLQPPPLPPPPPTPPPSPPTPPPSPSPSVSSLPHPLILHPLHNLPTPNLPTNTSHPQYFLK